MLNHHSALIYLMVMMSAADRNMTDSELSAIGEIVQYLPVFQDFNRALLPKIAEDCAVLMDQEGGFENLISQIKTALPEKLRETAYALTCDIALADSFLCPEEVRLMEIIRERLEIDPLAAAAIERASRARHMTL